jgi:hypothetical protein
MLRIDPQIAAWIPPSWIAAGSAAVLLAIIGALAFPRSRNGFAAAATRALVILIAAALGGSLAFAYFDNAARGLRNAERSALEQRAGLLTAPSLMPGSPLACLDPLAGDSVQAACERAVFASPASVATAISYVAAQFALLSDMADYARRGGTGIDDTLLPLRRALEADPFGLLAHVLVTGDGCTSENCPALNLLRDPSHVRTNIIAQTLHHYLDHYREVWARSPDAAVADTAGLATAAVPETSATAKRKVPVDIDFPSAASIPPISIMNPEPKTPVERQAAGNPEAARGRAGTARADPVWTPAPGQPKQ